MVAAVAGLLAVVLTTAATPASGRVDPSREMQTWSKQSERFRYEGLDPRAQTATHTPDLAGTAATGRRAGRDPRTAPVTVCATHLDGCAGDPQLAGWAGHGRVREPVAFVNRHGARLSGHLWMIRDAAERLWPHRRPAVVITTGSIQAPEQAYWWAAQVLAGHGFVVLTFDSQGQGASSTTGDGWDTAGGVPSEPLVNFVDNTRDALDFLLSTPGDPYRPATAGGTASQRRRVADGMADAFDPLWQSVDPGRIGLAGHSSGAFADSFLATVDPRVDALVAWDNVEVRIPRGVDATGIGQGVVDTDPAIGRQPFTPRVPALGLSVDYGVDSGPDRTFFPGPFVDRPDPAGKLQAFEAYRDAGVDSAEIVIRGGTHFEFSYILNPAFSATLRGIDLAAWYTAAWFDRYLWHDPTATGRLLSDRWRHDPVDAAIDPSGGGNLLSAHFPSRLFVTGPHGARVDCRDLRAGCPALRPATGDGYPAAYRLEDDRAGTYAPRRDPAPR